MPTLDFSIDGIPLRSGPDIELVILSAIGFLDDERARQEWLRAAVNARTAQQLASFSPEERGELMPAVPAVHQRVIAAAGTRLDRDKDGPELRIHTRDTRAAAFILVRTLASVPQRGSVSNAIDAYITGDGRRGSVPGASTETLKRAWRKYRPIAHFEALFVFHRGVLRDDPRAALAWAESLRIAGEKYRPWRGREPLLDARLTWKAPMSLGLHIVPLDQLGLPSDPKAVTFDP